MRVYICDIDLACTICLALTFGGATGSIGKVPTPTGYPSTDIVAGPPAEAMFTVSGSGVGAAGNLLAGSGSAMLTVAAADKYGNAIANDVAAEQPLDLLITLPSGALTKPGLSEVGVLLRTSTKPPRTNSTRLHDNSTCGQCMLRSRIQCSFSRTLLYGRTTTLRQWILVRGVLDSDHCRCACCAASIRWSVTRGRRRRGRCGLGCGGCAGGSGRCELRCHRNRT